MRTDAIRPKSPVWSTKHHSDRRYVHGGFSLVWFAFAVSTPLLDYKRETVRILQLLSQRLAHSSQSYRSSAHAHASRTAGSASRSPSMSAGRAVPVRPIAQRIGGLAKQTAPLGPQHGTAAEPLAKGGFVHAQQLGQLDRIRIGPRLKGRLGGRRHAAIERANVLADVAAEDPRANRRALLGRNRLAKLDRQIGDALPRVETIGLDDRARRAGVDAGPAGAAVAGRQRARRRPAFRWSSKAASRNQLPNCRFKSNVFLPTQPRPANSANSRSKSGAVSTTPRTAAPGVNSR